MSSNDYFQHEIDLIRQAQKLCSSAAAPDEIRNQLEEITSTFEETLKEVYQVFSVSDQLESDLSERVRYRTQELESERTKLEKLVSLGIAMTAERNETKLVEMILDGAKKIANADAGTLYLLNKENNLEFQIIKTDSLDVYLGGSNGAPITIPAVSLYNEAGIENHSNVVSHSVLTRETLVIDDAYDSNLIVERGFDLSGTREFDEKNEYRSVSFLTVPMITRSGESVGALQLINALGSDKGSSKPIPFDSSIVRFVEALAAQASVAIENQRLLEAQRVLMDSFIELIASAIDAKSPYTGGHCNRVPKLAMMLCEKANQSEAGEFKDFRFTTEDQWHEFRTAAWLHDCGKVITPEHVVDKATKLETIYNRIHEVRTRFEVLLRDAKIEALERKLAGEQSDKVDTELEQKLSQIQQDYEFVAKCNIGGEFMSSELKDRLSDIAQQSWTRHLSDRIGLSRQERLALTDFPEPVLPHKEPILADKDSHKSKREPGFELFMAEHGFDMEIPEYKSNTGELYNLSIGRGTLNSEERFKINEHIIQTIVMLERLPLPAHLANIPEYAGAHHETMIGTGYPRKLSKQQMSVPARIMAIADVFEALTAADRPYKEAKTLTESLKIMHFMVKDQHLDADLFRLFLESGVYREYADQFLRADQMDDPDINTYLG